MDFPVKIEHIDDKPAEEPVDGVSNDTGIKERFDEERSTENRASFPDEKGKRDNCKDGQRPHLALKHPPGATAVLDIGEIEKVWNNGNRRLPLQKADGEFLDDRVEKNEIQNGDKGDEKTSHVLPRSISL